MNKYVKKLLLLVVSIILCSIVLVTNCDIGCKVSLAKETDVNESMSATADFFNKLKNDNVIQAIRDSYFVSNSGNTVDTYIASIYDTEVFMATYFEDANFGELSLIYQDDNYITLQTKMTGDTYRYWYIYIAATLLSDYTYSYEVSEIAEYEQKILEEIVAQGTSYEQNVQINLIKVGSEWKVIYDENLINQLLQPMKNQLTNLKSIFG